MTTNLNQLAARIADLSRALEDMDGTAKAELRAAMESLYVPAAPTPRGMKGASPLDSQLTSTATDAEWAARQCDEAAARYDRLTEQVASILRSPTLKALSIVAEDGKAGAKARSAECERMDADARSELERRQRAREEAQAEAAKAQEAAKQVERLKRELATLRATFS